MSRKHDTESVYSTASTAMTRRCLLNARHPAACPRDDDRDGVGQAAPAYSPQTLKCFDSFSPWRW